MCNVSYYAQRMVTKTVTDDFKWEMIYFGLWFQMFQYMVASLPLKQETP